MPAKLYTLSPTEIEILKQGKEDPNLVLGYFVRRPGQDIGYQLDYNFTEEGKWQENVCMATQTFIVVVAGIATGKTESVGLDGVYHCIETNDFKFLNIARESWQSALMHTSIMEHARGTLLEKIIVSAPTRPYPKIVIEYMINGQVHHSTMEFMSVGEKEDATNVFSWRGDWINIDEAGRLDDLSGVVANLSTRGTGNTPSGRAYLGRMSLISNPWENPDLWILFDLAVANPSGKSLAINVNTVDNKNVNDDQVDQIRTLNHMDGQDKDRFLTSERPEGRGNYFSKDVVDKCASDIMSQFYIDTKRSMPAETTLNEHKHLGVYFMQMPRKEGRVYFEIGDPGIGAAPARNAPCLMVFDVTDCPASAANLVAFWWGNGMNSITPFVTNLLAWIEYYKPIFVGIDNTGPQKNTAEMLNLDHVWGKALSVPTITGLDFSGPRKYSYLVSLRLSLEAKMLMWPSFCFGIRSQLVNYDPTLDKIAGAKLAQDTVATLSMAAFAIRAQYGIFKQEGDESESGGSTGGSRDTLRSDRQGNDILRSDRMVQQGREIN